MDSGCLWSRIMGRKWLEKPAGHLWGLAVHLARDVNSKLLLLGDLNKTAVRVFRVSSVAARAAQREGRSLRETKLSIQAAGEWSCTCWAGRPVIASLRGQSGTSLGVVLSRQKGGWTWAEAEEEDWEGNQKYFTKYWLVFCYCDTIPCPQTT